MTQLHTYDVAIIGAGPIGLELATCLKRAGVDYIHFDAQQIGYTLTWWPRNTSFFSTTERLAIAGVPIQNNHQQRITGEEYLSYLMTGESLVVSKDNDWKKWYDQTSGRLLQVQNNDGSWNGHHCITSPVFCTATCLLILSIDKDIDFLIKVK